MSEKTVGLRDPEGLRKLRANLAQRSGVQVSASKAIELAVNVALKSLGNNSDATIYSESALMKLLRQKTFAATVANLRMALHHFEPDFEVIADPETCSLEIRRVKDGVDRTVLVPGPQEPAQETAPVGVN